MKKLNGYQAQIIETGLKLYAEAIKEEIQKVIDSGKNPLMTKGFIDMQVEETIEAVKLLTKKK